MTRINLVPVEELADQHLFAEFREMKMVPMSLRRSIAARGVVGVLQRIPIDYTLGTGHVTFFYDKGAYMRARYVAIMRELDVRGVNYDRTSPLDRTGVWGEYTEFDKPYTPTREALGIIRKRIAEKVALKPAWYRYSRPR